MLENLNLVFHQYKNFDLGKTKILQTINKLKNLDINNNLKILALRKVCIFQRDSIEAVSPYFNDKLFVLDEQLLHKPEQIFKEDLLVIENEYGACLIKNIVRFNSSKKQFEYILDIDVNRKLLKDQDISTQLDLINQEHFNIFSWTVKTKFLEAIDQ